jgi:hypothetical protein
MVTSEASLPRPLAQRERHILELILSAPFVGAGELKRQLKYVVVTRRWGAESPSVDLAVGEPSLRAEVRDGVLPATGSVTDASGNTIGELLVWVSGGLLAGLEYTWYTDDAPTELPDVAFVAVAGEE